VIKVIRPDIPLLVPIAEVELLIFLLDSSTSMASQKTFSGKTKSQVLFFFVENLLNRLAKSSKNPAFRISLIYFSDLVISLKYNNRFKYYFVKNALKILKEPFDVIPGGATAIGDAFIEAKKILDIFSRDEGLPSVKRATIFLFTDGRENIMSHDHLISIVDDVKSHIVPPSVATISLGQDADKDLLIELASRPNGDQLRHLEVAGLCDYLEVSNKLFIEAHEGDKLTKKRIEILRNFVETLSETMKRQGK